MKEFIGTIIAIALACAALVAFIILCPKCIKTEVRTVKVQIVDEYYKAPYVTRRKVGKTRINQPHFAEYKITVEYNNVKYVIDGDETYEKYKEKVGENAFGTLEIRTYDNGDTKYKIIMLE